MSKRECVRAHRLGFVFRGCAWYSGKHASRLFPEYRNVSERGRAKERKSEGDLHTQMQCSKVSFHTAIQATALKLGEQVQSGWRGVVRGGDKGLREISLCDML